MYPRADWMELDPLGPLGVDPTEDMDPLAPPAPEALVDDTAPDPASSTQQELTT